MTTRRGPILVAGLGAGDPLRLLLRDPSLLIASDPCDAHRAAFELRMAALKCLGHREFLQMGCVDRWPRIYPRIRWLLSDRAAPAWDGRIVALRNVQPPDADDFARMKERATRIELVARPLDDLLAGLPAGFVDGLVPGSACGSDPSRLEAEALRVVRRAPPAAAARLRVSAAVAS